MILTAAIKQDYHLPTAPHWAGGIGILNVAAQPQPCGFFVSNARPPVMTGWMEHPQGWPGATSVCQLRSVRLLMIGIVWRRVLNSFLKVAIMNTTPQTTPELNPELAIINGEIKTTSLKIAEHFGKAHYRVLRAIESLECSPEFAAANFGVSKYQVVGGKNASREETMYEITRDGFMFLAMGFTGAKAAQWKEAYITTFNRMESELHGKATETAKTLPPAGPFAKEVESAIERRAHTLSLRQYDKIKEQLREAIRKWGKDLEGQKLVEFIQHIDLPDSKLVIVHRDTLWQLTSCLAYLDIAQKKALSSINALEQETGMPWYGRD